MAVEPKTVLAVQIVVAVLVTLFTQNGAASVDSPSRHATTRFEYATAIAEPRALFNQMVPSLATESTFFAPIAHSFGHMGLQEVEAGFWYQGQVIFTMTSKGCDADPANCPENLRPKILTCGEHAVCDYARGNSVDGKFTFHQDTSSKLKYSFLIEAFETTIEKARYDAYFYAKEVGGWVLVAQVEVNVGPDPWYINSPYSYVEQWDTTKPQHERWAEFGPAFVEGFDNPGHWQQLTETNFKWTTADHDRQDNIHANVTVDQKRWGMGSGGSIVRVLEQNVRLEVARQAPPLAMEEFIELRTSNALPTGCEGKTCLKSRLVRICDSIFTKKYFPIILLAFIIVIYLVGKTVLDKVKARRNLIVDKDRFLRPGEMPQYA